LHKRNLTLSVIIILIASVAALYACAVILHADIWGGIMSMLSSAVAGAVILVSYKSSLKTPATRLLPLLAAACFAWTAGDVVIGILRFRDIPGGDILQSVAFFIPNVLFAVGALLFGYYKFSKWRVLKGVMESLTIGTLSIIFMWLVFFNKGQAAVTLLTRDGIISVMSILLDIFLCIQIILLFFAGIQVKMPISVVLIISGIFLYSANDIVYYVMVFIEGYSLNSILDFLYSAALLLVASGSLAIMLNGNTGFMVQESTRTKSVSGGKWLWLLVFPAIAIAVGSAEAIDILVFAVIIGLYQAATIFIRIARENEELYRDQFTINEKLERRLDEQLAEMTALANQDTLTKLFNRRHFTGCIQEITGTLKTGDKVAVLLFDIDRFKTINDSYGHDVGDKVIIEVSNRLMEWDTCGATLARLGGDEFAVMLTGNLSRHELTCYCKQLIEICAAPIFVENQVLYLTISIGVSVCPDDAGDSVALLKNADISMYRAKAEGFNKTVFYCPQFKDNITRKNEIEALLRKSDLEKDFELVFQPQFMLPDLRLIGAEALIRWKSPEHGYIPPSVFVPVAEEIDFIHKIGKFVLVKAVEQIVAWNNTYGINLKMGINISPKQLSEDDFFMTLKTIILSRQVNSAWIDAEITENLMIEDSARVKPIFDLFKELGISVSIDDFGSGYSSLGYLNKYRFDRIKIDKSLIDNLQSSGGNGVEVVKAIIKLADAVGKTTIAEGVESREQLKILRQLGCGQVQGYLVGKPVTAAVFARNFIEKDLGPADENVRKKPVKTRPAEAM
jgi:diguanylate cyclase (GGDEF)-like protein